MIGFGQNANIPDANFKAYLVANSLINANGDTEIQISEANAFNGEIICSSMNISDLTSIEAFTRITSLDCDDNNLIYLDASANTSLFNLDCSDNDITSVNINGVSILNDFYCSRNNIAILDISNATALRSFSCRENQLTDLDVRNGNNINFYNFYTTGNPNLNCINVDDASFSSANWTNIDPQNYFNENCPPSSIKEHTRNKELLKVTDLLGRETKQTNQSLFYIYNDGTVEKRIVIE